MKDVETQSSKDESLPSGVDEEVEASIELDEVEWDAKERQSGTLSKEDDSAAQAGPRNLKETIYEKLIRPVFNADDTPESIALACAVGMFVALTPTVGIQMPVAIFIGTLINKYTRRQMNNIVGAAMCWVSNPLTFVPMYYGYLWLGWTLMGRDTSSLLSLSAWQTRLTSYITTTSPSTLDYVKGFFLAGLGELAAPMWLGSIIIAVVISIPTYPIALRLVRAFQQRKAEQGAS